MALSCQSLRLRISAASPQEGLNGQVSKPADCHCLTEARAADSSCFSCFLATALPADSTTKHVYNDKSPRPFIGREQGPVHTFRLRNQSKELRFISTPFAEFLQLVLHLRRAVEETNK